MRREWLETDYYAVLGVPKNASQNDIKKAFRKLARDFHPDANEDNPDTESRFKQANEAYEVLGDPETRKEYDHAREVGYFVGGPGGDVAADLSLSFHEAISGVTKQINIDGNTVKVKIPKGVDDGTRIRLKGKGSPGIRGGPPGDAYITVHVAEHPLFARSGQNLGITVPITFAEAALGAEIQAPTLEGSVRLRIPPGTKTGKTFRVSGRGVESAKERGDLLVTVEVTVPKDLTDEQRALLEKFRDNGPDENPRAHLGV
jgi:DnaJ-class molecular chaperone